MKLSLGTRKMRLARQWTLAAGIAGGILLSVGAIGCGQKGGAARPAGATTTEKRDASFALPLKQQVRWTYTGDPVPALRQKPAYLLKTIGFAKSSTSVDGEASAVIRDLAASMQERPRIRVLFLGLTDRGPEALNAEDLGLKRARSAREALVAQGIVKDRTEAATFGSSVATGDPSDAVSQEKDRRVEVWLIEE